MTSRALWTVRTLAALAIAAEVAIGVVGRMSVLPVDPLWSRAAAIGFTFLVGMLSFHPWWQRRERMRAAMQAVVWVITAHVLLLVHVNELDPWIHMGVMVLIASILVTSHHTFASARRFGVYLAAVGVAVVALVLPREQDPAMAAWTLASYGTVLAISWFAASTYMSTLEQLRRSEAHHRRLTEALPDSLLHVVDGRVVSVDAKGALTSHLSGSEGRPVNSVLPVDPEEPTRAATLDTPEGTRHVELRLVRLEPHEDLVVVRDQTEERELAERVEAADHLATLGTLAASVAHEINNPLAYVLANLDHVVACAEGEQREALDDVRDGARRIAQIVDDLRNLSRDETTSADPVHAIAAARRLAGPRVRHQAELVVDVADELDSLAISEPRLVQVLLNLIVNAAQAMPADRAENRIIVRAAQPEAERALLHVIDNGTGIPDALRDRVFEPFFTTKGVEGTGLGLHVCKRLVTDAGGRLDVRETPGGGTTFALELPVLAREEPTHVRAARGSGVQARVLVIDDEPAIGRTLRRALRPHTVIVADDAEAGLARALVENFDVVFCDLMMPRLDGRALHRQLLRARPEMAPRFLVITGGALTADTERFLASQGEDQVITKPFELSRVRAAIDRVLARGGRLEPDDAERAL